MTSAPSCAAKGGHSVGVLSSLGLAGCRAGYRSTQGLLVTCPSRAVLREPLVAEQVVEVLRVLSHAFLQQRNEQIIDIPVPRHGGSRSLQGVHPGPGSLQCSVEQNVDIPVPRRGGIWHWIPVLSSWP